MSNQSSQQNAAFFIKDIVILQSPGTVELGRKIRTALEEGWTVHGDLMIHPDGSFVQTMVKYDERLVALTEATMEMVSQQLNQFR